jgi:hypothetical protein
LTPAETIRAITEAGGIAVIAHPAHSGPAAIERIPEFVGYGLRGVEVYYPHHSPDDVERLLGLCREYGLLTTGGSDFHGGGVLGEMALGSVDVPWECLERLRESKAVERSPER